MFTLYELNSLCSVLDKIVIELVTEDDDDALISLFIADMRLYRTKIRTGVS